MVVEGDVFRVFPQRASGLGKDIARRLVVSKRSEAATVPPDHRSLIIASLVSKHSRNRVAARDKVHNVQIRQHVVCLVLVTSSGAGCVSSASGTALCGRNRLLDIDHPYLKP